MGCLDEFFNGELHYFYDKDAAIRNANRIVVGKKVGCEFVSKGVGDVACNEGGVRGILV